jgi:hypothetical protein
MATFFKLSGVVFPEFFVFAAERVLAKKPVVTGKVFVEVLLQFFLAEILWAIGHEIAKVLSDIIVKLSGSLTGLAAVDALES